MVFKNERANVVATIIVQLIRNIKLVRKILVRHVRVVIGHFGPRVQYLVALVVPRHEYEHVLMARTVHLVKRKKKVFGTRGTMFGGNKFTL